MRARVTMDNGDEHYVAVNDGTKAGDYTNLLGTERSLNWWVIHTAPSPPPCTCCHHFPERQREILLFTDHITSIEIVS